MSVALLPKYRPEGAFEDETPEETATRLHLEHNTVPKPPVRFVPSVPTEFPFALYREWAPEDRDRQELRAALANGLSLDNPREARIVASMIPPYDSMLVHSDRERSEKRSEGWSLHPSEMKADRAKRDRALYESAGHRNFDDRHITGPAKVEMDAVDDAADDHVLDVSATQRQLEDAGTLPKRRGRPRKTQEPS